MLDCWLMRTHIKASTIMYLYKLVKNYVMSMLKYSSVEVILYLHNIIPHFSY